MAEAVRSIRRRAVLAFLPGTLLASFALAAPPPERLPDIGPDPLGAPVGIVVKQPYLIYPDDPGRMRVLWQLSSPGTSTLAWGLDPSCSLDSVRTAGYGSDHQHAHTITGLVPAKRYYYRVTVRGVSYAGSFFTAPPSDATRLKFLIYGDTRTYPIYHNLLARVMNATLQADSAYQTFALFTGDAVAEGAIESHWVDQFFSPYLPEIRQLTASLPYAACMGNHERDGSLFLKYFPYPWVAGRYRSFDYGPVHVAIVDQWTDYAPGSAQLQWLAADLQASTKPWKFLLFHKPGWSAGGGHANDVAVQARIQPLAEQYGVSIVFTGHNHYYARARVNGVWHVTAGGGGAPLAVPVLPADSVLVAQPLRHFCAVDIDGPTLRLRAIDLFGTVIDSLRLGEPVVGVEPDEGGLLGLSSPLPSPSFGAVSLQFSLPHAGSARLEIIDLSGRRVWRLDERLSAGPHTRRWDGRTESGQRASAGLYFVHLVTPWGARTQRLVRLQ